MIDQPNSDAPSSSTDSNDDSHTFFSGHRSFRSPKTIIAVVISGGVSAYVWWLYSLPPGKDTSGKELPLIIACIFTFITVAGAKRVFAGERWNAILSDQGVTYGNDFWPWSQVKKVSLNRKSFSQNVVPKIMLADNSRLILLITDQPLSPQSGDELIATLRLWLQQRHPNVQVG